MSEIAIERERAREKWVEREGQRFEPTSYDSRRYGRRRKAKMCFRNALKLAWKFPELRYAEGFATSADVGKPPIFHAWCVDAEGRVVDPTWQPEGYDYFGVIFSTQEASRAVVDSGYFGVIESLLHEHAGP